MSGDGEVIVKLRYLLLFVLALLLWPIPAYPQSVQVEPRGPANPRPPPDVGRVPGGWAG